MFRLLTLLAVLTFASLPAKGLSELQGLVQYDCTQDCNLKCWGPEGNIDLTYRTLTVFQWKDHVRRLWISVNNTNYVLGDDTSCRFEGTPKFEYQRSNLNQPPISPQCICIGNQCTPPGCNMRK